MIFLGSSCVYPKNCKQPIKEKYLLTGKLESTNDAYAIAKIAGMKCKYSIVLSLVLLLIKAFMYKKTQAGAT